MHAGSSTTKFHELQIASGLISSAIRCYCSRKLKNGMSKQIKRSNARTLSGQASSKGKHLGFLRILLSFNHGLALPEIPWRHVAKAVHGFCRNSVNRCLASW